MNVNESALNTGYSGALSKLAKIHTKLTLEEFLYKNRDLDFIKQLLKELHNDKRFWIKRRKYYEESHRTDRESLIRSCELELKKRLNYIEIVKRARKRLYNKSSYIKRTNYIQ